MKDVTKSVEKTLIPNLYSLLSKKRLISKLLLSILLLSNLALAQSWHMVPGSPNNVRSIACDPNNGNLWVGTQGGDVYLYNGTSWEQKTRPTTATISSIAVAPNGNIYVGVFNGYLYRSTNGGTSWTSVFYTRTGNTICDMVISLAGAVYFVACSDGFYRPNGNSWTNSTSGLSYNDVHSIKIAPNGTLYAGTNSEGVYRSTNNGATWLSPNNFRTLFVTGIAIIDNNILFASGGNRGLLKSTDGGQNWGLNLNDVYDVTYNSTTQILFADVHGYPLSKSNVFVSTNLGESWEVRNDGLGTSFYLMSEWRNVNSFAFNRITGTTYTRQLDGYVYSYGTPVKVAIPKNYAVKPNETIKVSVNAIDDLAGKNAKSFSFVLKYNKRILSVKDVTSTISSSLSISTTGSTPGELKVIATNNAGTLLSGTGSLVDINFLGLRGDSCGTHLVLESFTFNSDGPNAIKEDGYCELFGGCGELPYVSNDVSTMLSQNNPNPVREGYESTIQYRINVAGDVNLTVYDVLGREIARLVDEYKSEGTYSVSFNTKGLSSGVYFYKLRAPGYEGLKKMAVIK